jgi:simple sugar transport system permease protein
MEFSMKRFLRRDVIMPVVLLALITILLKLTYDAVDDVETFYALTGWLLKATLQSATPLILAALGGMFSEKSGVVNIGLEGMMLIGAFAAVAATYFFYDPWIGLLTAVLAGGLLAVVHAIISVKMKGNHIVSGTGIILFAAGFTTLMLEVIWNRKGMSEQVTALPNVGMPFLQDIPIIGVAFDNLSPIVYFAFVLVIVSWYVMYRTPFGLRLRAAGEDPSTLDAAGISVEKYRFIGVVISGLLAGLGGAYISIGFGLPAFGKQMTAGRGFIALAALIFGNWSPFGLLAAGLFFGFLDTLQYFVLFVPAWEWVQGYSQFLQMIPYVLVVLALAGIRKSVPPKGIAVPYEKEAKA